MAVCVVCMAAQYFFYGACSVLLVEVLHNTSPGLLGLSLFGVGTDVEIYWGRPFCHFVFSVSM